MPGVRPADALADVAQATDPPVVAVDAGAAVSPSAPAASPDAGIDRQAPKPPTIVDEREDQGRRAEHGRGSAACNHGAGSHPSGVALALLALL